MLKPSIDKDMNFFYKDMPRSFARVSLQVVNDFKECYLCSLKSEMLGTLRRWNATNFVQNVSYIEQKQQEVLNEYGALYYEFLLEDYREALELFEMDLKKCGLSSNSVSRVMSLVRIIYGNRTEIETGLVST